MTIIKVSLGETQRVRGVLFFFRLFCVTSVIFFHTMTVGVGPASVMVGNLVAGKRIAQAAGRDLGMIEDQDLVRKVV